MAIQEKSPNQARLLLSKIREGDYAHAGDVEAIEMVLEKVFKLSPEIQKEQALDVGCGFGGTAYYLYENGFNKLHGIDNDEAAVTYAKSKYPNIPFCKLNALDIHKAYPSDYFGFIYLLNVAYAIEDKEALLKSLNTVMKPQGTLVLFDYACTGENLMKLRT